MEIRCVSIHDHDRLQTTVGPAVVAADTLRVCPVASGFGFAHHVINNNNNDNGEGRIKMCAPRGAAESGGAGRGRPLPGAP